MKLPMSRFQFGVVAVVFSLAVIVGVSSAGGVNFTGFFKAFDKTLYPGNNYERNITVREYYNTSVRFVKVNGSSYLTFDDDDCIVVLKDSSGNEIFRFVGIEDGKGYDIVNNSILSKIDKVYVYNMDAYEDVMGQSPEVTSIGTKTYITVVVEERAKPVKLYGYVSDELTGELLDGIEVAVFENDADAAVSEAITSYNTSGGYYEFDFDIGGGTAIDVYVRDVYASS